MRKKIMITAAGHLDIVIHNRRTKIVAGKSTQSLKRQDFMKVKMSV